MTTYRATFAARPEWLAECARQGWAYKPHRAVTTLDLRYEDAIAWALARFDPFRGTP